MTDRSAPLSPRAARRAAARSMTPAERAHTRRQRRAQRRADRARLREERRAQRPHSIAGHLIRAGETTETARGMSSALRTAAKRAGVTGVQQRTRRTVDTRRGRLRTVTRYTRAEMRAALLNYRPRKRTYQDARARLLDLAA